jgi:hypothetical protein
MRTQRTPQTEFSRNLALRRRFGHMGRRPLAVFAPRAALFAALFAALALLAGPILAAQSSPAPAPAAAHAHKPVHSLKKPVAGQPAVQPAAQPVTPPAPALPKAPDWPANDLPAEASVVWDSHGLLIVASNSSLAQILKEVATQTGAKVEGMDTDQRVFGTYGPASVRDVLSQLLDGSGYNVLMIGDRGQGTPRRVVLSIRTGGGIQRTVNNTPGAPSEEDTESDQQAQEPEQPPTPAPSGFAPAVPARPPQQIIQELQQRQRQLQQQGNQQNPQN